MKRIFLPLLALSACAAVALSGCSEESTLQRYFYSMHYSATLSVTDKFSSARKSAAEELFSVTGELLRAFDESLSATRAGSCTSKFNDAQAGEEVEVDGVFYEVLSAAKTAYEKTDGAYNPAVYYSVRAYGFGAEIANGDGAPPAVFPAESQTRLYADLAAQFSKVELSERDGKYFVKKPSETVETEEGTLSLKIDLGGIGKGYAVDRIAKETEGRGFKYGYFDFGESSIYCFEHGKNGDYEFSFGNPRGEGDYLSLKTRNCSVTTSGDYENYYEIEGVRYCSIIDPATGMPVQNGVFSASIVGGSACENDAYTTAIMAMGKERARKFIKDNLSDRLVFFTFAEGDTLKVCTNAPAGSFETVAEVEYVL